MKKTLSVLAVLGMILFIGNQSADAAFSWNPAHWFGHGCNKCEKKKPVCGCPRNDTCPSTTGAAAPCSPCIKENNPCQKAIPEPQPCDACDRLQQELQSK